MFLAKITEKIEDMYFKNNKKLILLEGYIKNQSQSYYEFINKQYKINLITLQQKNTNNDSNNSKLLNIRYVV